MAPADGRDGFHRLAHRTADLVGTSRAFAFAVAAALLGGAAVPYGPGAAMSPA